MGSERRGPVVPSGKSGRMSFPHGKKKDGGTEALILLQGRGDGHMGKGGRKEVNWSPGTVQVV